MKYPVLVCLIVFTLTASAQERLITGRIVDKNTQKPIENADILVKGTTSGTVSNSMGYFQLKLNPNYNTLVVSHLSYLMISTQVPESDNFKIELEEIYIVLPKVVLSFQPPELSPFQPDTLEIDSKSSREVEQSAGYYGGMEYLNYYLTTNYKYPEGLDSLIVGETYVSFEIDITGAVDSVRIHNDSLNVKMHDQIIELFSTMPNWRPAYQHNIPIRQKFIVPVRYGLVSKSNSTDTYLHYCLKKNITYPTEALRVALEGTVFVYFSLNSQQDFNRLEILQGIGSGCDKMVYNAIQSIPKAELKSLMANIGDSVFILPVDFRLDGTSLVEDKLLNLTEAVFLMPIEVLASKPNSYYSSSTGMNYPTREFYSVEGALKHIYYASKLRIVNQQLSSLSPDVGKLTNLLLLDLENNKLESLPPEFTNLLSLQEFYAPKNKLSSLPSGMQDMRQLKIIGLAYNDFTEFPAEILSLKKIQAQELSFNKISKIPPEIGNLKNLKVLIFRNNNLQELPEEFFKLKLDEIYLSGNNLSEELKQKIKESFKNAKIIL